MGSYTEAKIEAWQKAAGIEPATGRKAELLRKLSDKAFELIKVIELECSGIRDGDGYWHGSDVMGGIMGDIVGLCQGYTDPDVMGLPLPVQKVKDVSHDDGSWLFD